MKKILAVILSVIMCLALLASCSTPDDKPGESTPDKAPESSTPDASSSEESSSTPTESSPEEESSDTGIDVEMPTPQNLDRDMAVFIGELHYEEWLSEDDGDIVNTELFGRVHRVEENLGIDLTVNKIPGTGGERTNVYNEVVKYSESTDPLLKVDLCSTYSAWAGTFALEGRYLNIAASDNVNFDMPYWPADIINGSSIDDKVYTVSGDISPTLLWETYCIFFNIKLVEKYNIPNPIDLVNNKEWTLDKVIELTKDIYSDDDKTVSGPNLGDMFSFTFSDKAHIKAFPFALGLRVLENDEDAGYVLSELYKGEKADGIITKIRDWINNNNGVGVGGLITGMGYGQAFRNDQAIFNVGNFAFTKYYLADTGVEYGVVPCPLFDDEQEAYYSYYGNPSAFWGVPCNVTNLDDSCALLESLAADAYIHISPAIFERALKHKYNPGDLSGQSHMFDIIRDGLVFDPCMIFGETLTKYKQWNEIVDSNGSWSANFNGFSIKAWDTHVETIVTKIRALPY